MQIIKHHVCEPDWRNMQNAAYNIWPQRIPLYEHNIGGKVIYETTGNLYPSLYNAKWHMMRAESLDQWRKRYGGSIHIMCVEFGGIDRLTPVKFWKTAVEGSGIPDVDRVQFIHDMRSAFDTYGIGWCYWSYNEAHTVFLPEEHHFGESPLPEQAVKLYDIRLLTIGLGVVPLPSEGSR